VLSRILAKNICGEGRAVKMWSTGRSPCALHHTAPVFSAFLMATVGATLPKKQGSCCHRYLLTAYPKSVTACKVAMERNSIWEQTFLTTDDRIKSEEGCTATALLVWTDDLGNVCLQAANVGDSAVVYSDGVHKEGIQMTADHRLTNPDERQRLADMGIHLGQDRTRLYGLNLSRCLGDKFLKDEDLGLSAQPHVSSVIKIAPDQSGIVIMASDGLWDVTDAQCVLQIVSRIAKQSNGSVKAMTDAVVQHAQRQRTRDDLTVVLLKVKALGSSSSFV